MVSFGSLSLIRTLLRAMRFTFARHSNAAGRFSETAGFWRGPAAPEQPIPIVSPVPARAPPPFVCGPGRPVQRLQQRFRDSRGWIGANRSDPLRQCGSDDLLDRRGVSRRAQQRQRAGLSSTSRGGWSLSRRNHGHHREQWPRPFSRPRRSSLRLPAGTKCFRAGASRTSP